jgi:hypothetical protein
MSSKCEHVSVQSMKAPNAIAMNGFAKSVISLSLRHYGCLCTTQTQGPFSGRALPLRQNLMSARVGPELRPLATEHPANKNRSGRPA